MSGVHHFYTVTGRALPLPPRRTPSRHSAILRLPTYRYDPSSHRNMRSASCGRVEVPHGGEFHPITAEEAIASQLVVYHGRRTRGGQGDGGSSQRSINSRTLPQRANGSTADGSRRSSRRGSALASSIQQQSRSSTGNPEEEVTLHGHPIYAAAESPDVANDAARERYQDSADRSSTPRLNRLSRAAASQSIATSGTRNSPSFEVVNPSSFNQAASSDRGVSAVSSRQDLKQQRQSSYREVASMSYGAASSPNTPSVDPLAAAAAAADAPRSVGGGSERLNMATLAAVRVERSMSFNRQSPHHPEIDLNKPIELRVRQSSGAPHRARVSGGIEGPELLPPMPQLQGLAPRNRDRPYRTVVRFINYQPQSEHEGLGQMLEEYRGHEEELCTALGEAYGDDFDAMKGSLQRGPAVGMIEYHRPLSPRRQITASSHASHVRQTDSSRSTHSAAGVVEVRSSAAPSAQLHSSRGYNSTSSSQEASQAGKNRRYGGAAISHEVPPSSSSVAPLWNSRNNDYDGDYDSDLGKENSGIDQQGMMLTPSLPPSM